MYFPIRLSFFAKIVPILMVFLMYYGTLTIIKNTKVFVKADLILSVELQESIKQQVENLKHISANSLLENLHENYSSIESIEIKNRSFLSKIIVINASKPILFLKEKSNIYILNLSGEISQLSEYSQSSIEQLPTIFFDSLEDIKQDNKILINFITNLDYGLFQTYDIFWHKKSKIILKAKNNDYKIIADINSILKKDRILFAENIYKVKNQKLKFDIRFSDFLICTSKGDMQ